MEDPQATYQTHISIHALREEGDRCTGTRTSGGTSFLSTPSARRATDDKHAVPILRKISIHALREEGDVAGFDSVKAFQHFYPRPPRGGRLSAVASAPTRSIFLSTPSARRATWQR